MTNDPAKPQDCDPLDLELLRRLVSDQGFRRAVYAAVRCIPAGRVLGYGHVATLLGSPRAARQVGYALAALPPATDLPWWRVLRSNGSIALQGDPDRGPEQARRLEAEGVVVVQWKVDMAAVRWDPGVDPWVAP